MNHCQKPRRVGSNGRDIQIIFSIFFLSYQPKNLSAISKSSKSLVSNVKMPNKMHNYGHTYKNVLCTYGTRLSQKLQWKRFHFPTHFKLSWKAPVGSWTNVMTTLKILTNEKKGGLNLVSFVGLPLSCSRWDFQKNLCSWDPILWEASGSGSISQRHGSADPDPHQNFMDPQHWFALLGHMTQFEWLGKIPVFGVFWS
jgi:hypothetical protein